MKEKKDRGLFDKLFNSAGDAGMIGNKEELDFDKHDKDVEFAEDADLILREEDLDIDKYRAQTGEVAMHKDIVEEHKVVDVPVMHEEVIIERKALDHRQTDNPIGEEQTIHIPVSEERIDVDKHTELVGEVTAHKKSFEEMRHVDEVLRREEADIDIDGDAKIISKKQKQETVEIK